MQKIISIAAIAAVAFSATFVFFVKSPHADSETATTELEGRLKTAIPYEMDGWTSKDSGLGDTEEVQRAAEKVLNVTDYVNRTYSKNGTDFTVYIAYWKPDTMEIHRASSHSPDRCWVANGWKNIDSEKRNSNLSILATKNFSGDSLAHTRCRQKWGLLKGMFGIGILLTELLMAMESPTILRLLYQIG